MCSSKEDCHLFSTHSRFKESKTDWFWKSPSTWEATTLELSLWIQLRVSFVVKTSLTLVTPSQCQLDPPLSEEL